MLWRLMMDAAQQSNDTGVTCRWLLVGACTPMAVVIVALWRALEKQSAGRMEDLKENFKSLKHGDESERRP